MNFDWAELRHRWLCGRLRADTPSHAYQILVSAAHAAILPVDLERVGELLAVYNRRFNYGFPLIGLLPALDALRARVSQAEFNDVLFSLRLPPLPPPVNAHHCFDCPARNLEVFFTSKRGGYDLCPSCMQKREASGRAKEVGPDFPYCLLHYGEGGCGQVAYYLDTKPVPGDLLLSKGAYYPNGLPVPWGSEFRCGACGQLFHGLRSAWVVPNTEELCPIPREP